MVQVPRNEILLHKWSGGTTESRIVEGTLAAARRGLEIPYDLF